MYVFKGVFRTGNAKLMYAVLLSRATRRVEVWQWDPQTAQVQPVWSREYGGPPEERQAIDDAREAMRHVAREQQELAQTPKEKVG